MLNASDKTFLQTARHTFFFFFSDLRDIPFGKCRIPSPPLRSKGLPLRRHLQPVRPRLQHQGQRRPDRAGARRLVGLLQDIGAALQLRSRHQLQVRQPPADPLSVGRGHFGRAVTVNGPCRAGPAKASVCCTWPSRKKTYRLRSSCWSIRLTLESGIQRCAMLQVPAVEVFCSLHYYVTNGRLACECCEVSRAGAGG